MARTLRRLLALAVVVVVAGGVALVLTSRPDLSNTEESVATAWEEARPALDERYALLTAAGDAMKANGAGERDVVAALDDGLRRWADLGRAPTDDLPAQLAAANDLEGIGRRLLGNVLASPTLSSTAPIADAARAFAEAPAPPAVGVLDQAIADYADARQGVLRRLAASVLRYEPIPSLALGTAAPAPAADDAPAPAPGDG